MKKARIFMMIFIMLIMFLGITNTVFALGEGFDGSIFNQVNNGQVEAHVANVGERIYGTISTILKVLAMGGVVYTGVKYMMAEADAKGQMKTGLIYVVIGTVFVFAADAIIRLVINSNIF